MVPLSYVVDGVSHPDLNATATGDYKAFYAALRAGARRSPAAGRRGPAACRI